MKTADEIDSLRVGRGSSKTVIVGCKTGAIEWSENPKKNSLLVLLYTTRNETDRVDNLVRK